MQISFESAGGDLINTPPPFDGKVQPAVADKLPPSRLYKYPLNLLEGILSIHPPLWKKQAVRTYPSIDSRDGRSTVGLRVSTLKIPERFRKNGEKTGISGRQALNIERNLNISVNLKQLTDGFLLRFGQRIFQRGGCIDKTPSSRFKGYL